MNQRIREIAEQAGIKFVNVISGSAKPDVHCSDDELMKFALLIIQDCEKNCNRTVTGLS